MPAPPDYVDVSERIRQFYAKYPGGSLQSDVLFHGEGWVAVKALAYRNPEDRLPGIGLAWEPVPGPTPFTKNSELQNAETSAWGRAIVALGFETKNIASANDVRNRQAEGGGGDAASSSTSPAALTSPDPDRPQRTQAQNRKFNAVLKELNTLDGQDWKAKAKAYCIAEFGKESSTELNIDEMSTTIDEFEGQRLSLIAAREEATREAEALPF